METLGFIGCQFAVYMSQTCFLLALKHSVFHPIWTKEYTFYELVLRLLGLKRCVSEIKEICTQFSEPIEVFWDLKHLKNRLISESKCN